MTDFWFCGWKGHTESECLKKLSGSDRSRSSRGDADRLQISKYMEGFRQVGMGPTFVMKHKVTSMAVSTLKSKEVWYVGSNALNNMKNHEEWFFYLNNGAVRIH